jgi:hypothetical protein
MNSQSTVMKYKDKSKFIFQCAPCLCPYNLIACMVLIPEGSYRT